MFFDDIQQYGDAAALISDNEVTDYAHLARAADDFRSRTNGRHLAFLLADNTKESVIGYLGALRGRVPAALLPLSMHETLVADLLETYRPRYVWLPRERAAHLGAATAIHDFGTYVLLDTGADACDIHPDLALLTTTSGSTGSPKFVRQSYRNIAANTAAIGEYLAISAQDRAITSLPMNYVFGLSVINSHLACGASLVVTNRALMEKEFWQLMKTRQVTSLSGVPYTYQMLKQLRFGRMALPDLKVMTQAGGKLRPDLVSEFAAICRDKGIRFYVMYGAAEATARMSYLPPDEAVKRPDSIGIAIPGGAFSLIDDQGNPIDKDGVTGELVYRGDNVTMGYATCRADLALGDRNGGTLKTGDVAKRDTDGFYYIVGRKSRFIKIFGNRVNLEDLEQRLQHMGLDCACSGEDDRLRIFVTSEGAGRRAVEAVQELTGFHHSAFSFVVIDKIPRTESGKIIYSLLP